MFRRSSGCDSFPVFVYILDFIMMYAERNTDKFSGTVSQTSSRSGACRRAELKPNSSVYRLLFCLVSFYTQRRSLST